ncbi:hypothetical protein O181_096268 [Austropuccinia psidii MF-1]|uniref:Reverse transcriptase domain-containing protein n=1 Tax=Austropuccinia psidii MF-1 TaxID=1389203 RepID=A0A9Q3J5C4_9BASI|nr:hypothetical protein [Austropuccinia psidii MF-1]
MLHTLDKLAKSKYINKMNFMKGFHQNGVTPSSMKLLRIICHMGIYEYTRMPFGIENSPAHFQRILETIFQGEILEGWMVVYIDDIIIYSETWEDHVQYIDKVLKLFSLGHKVSVVNLAIDQSKLAEVLQHPVPKNIKDMQSLLGYELTNALVPILPEFELPFKLYIDAACSQRLGAALHQRKIVDSEPREGVICYSSRQLKYSESSYNATHTECLCLVWALEKFYYYLEGAVFEVYTDFTALNSLLNMKTMNRHISRWQIAIQEYRFNMTIIYKEGKIQKNSDGISRWPLENVKRNSAYEPEVAANIPIHSMQIDRRKNFRFTEWAPESGTLESEDTEPEGTETPILGIGYSELQNEFLT